MANLRTPIAPLKLPNGPITQEYANQLVRTVNQLVSALNNPGDFLCASLIIDPVALNGYGLPVGGVYDDGNGFLKIVSSDDVFAPSFLNFTKFNPPTVVIS